MTDWDARARRLLRGGFDSEYDVELVSASLREAYEEGRRAGIEEAAALLGALRAGADHYVDYYGAEPGCGDLALQWAYERDAYGNAAEQVRALLVKGDVR